MLDLYFEKIETKVSRPRPRPRAAPRLIRHRLHVLEVVGDVLRYLLLDVRQPAAAATAAAAFCERRVNAT